METTDGKLFHKRVMDSAEEAWSPVRFRGSQVGVSRGAPGFESRCWLLGRHAGDFFGRNRCSEDLLHTMSEISADSFL
jgi:hypothetical protein